MKGMLGILLALAICAGGAPEASAAQSPPFKVIELRSFWSKSPDVSVGYLPRIKLKVRLTRPLKGNVVIKITGFDIGSKSGLGHINANVIELEEGLPIGGEKSVDLYLKERAYLVGENDIPPVQVNIFWDESKLVYNTDDNWKKLKTVPVKELERWYD